MTQNLSASKARELLCYNPETGGFTWWLDCGNGTRAGAVAGCIRGNGYYVIRYLRICYMAHRLAWLITTGSWPQAEIDHINNVRSDNRFANLREATRSQNCHRRARSTKGLSSFKGVTFDNRAGRRKRWTAKIQIDSKSVHLGHYHTETEAHEAYKKAARQYYGEFAYG